MYHVTRLSDGLTVATAEMPHMASVCLGLWVGVGGRHEPKEVNGVSHFIEHMLFKGTRKRSAEEISQAVEGVGGYLNAFTEEESTCFYARACADRFGDLLEVLTDMFLSSVFDPREIQKEREVIKEELAMYLDQPHQHVQELLSETLWPDHALGRSLTGTEQTIESLSRRDMLAYQRQNYVSATTMIVAAGNIRHAQVVKAVKARSRHFTPGRSPRFVPYDQPQEQPRLHNLTKETSQSQMALGIRTCSRHDERRHALRVLNTILGENMSSRLFQVLREDHGLAYSIHSSLDFFDDVGALVISAGLDTDNLPRGLKLVMRELDRCAEKPPGAAELRRARDYLVGQFELNLEGTENQMNWLGEQLLAYGKIIPPDEAMQRILTVTPAQVRAAARDFFSPERLSLAMISPLKSTSGLMRILKSTRGQ
jgi:predicted Zn-dependent peptidase